jgi:hypothetical protein
MALSLLPVVYGYSFALTLPDRHALQPVEAFDPLVIDAAQLPLEQELQPPIAPARALRCQGAQAFPHSRLVTAGMHGGSAAHHACCGDAHQRVDTPDAATSHRSVADGPPQPVAQWALPVFAGDLFQRRVVQRQVGDDLLEATILLFQLPESPELAYLHAPVLRLPAVLGSLTDSVLAADLRHTLSRLC